jgi:hypothetical protein
MSKILKNNTGSAVPISDCGIEVPASGQFTIQPTDYPLFAMSGDTVELLSDGTLTMNDGSNDLALPQAVQYLQGGFNSVQVLQEPPFASKTVGSLGLFNRTHGKSFALTTGGNPNVCDFEVPYNQVKFNGVEIVGGELGDKVSLKIIDTDGDPTTPYYSQDAVLNQFGFDVYIVSDFYRRESRYDADLYKDMRIRIEYTTQSDKTIYVNYMLHELK